MFSVNQFPCCVARFLEDVMLYFAFSFYEILYFDQNKEGRWLDMNKGIL